MIRGVIWLALAPLAAQAQIQMTLVSDGQSTTLTPGDAYSVATVAPGAAYTFTVQIQNKGPAAVPCSPSGAGSGFSFNSPCGTSQAVVAPSGVVNVFFTFGPATPGSYNIAFSFDTVAPVIFVITVPSLTLTAGTPCTGPDATLAIDFGSIAEGQTAVCKMTLTNTGLQAVTASIQVTGAGFLPSLASAAQVTLQPSGATTFTITFEPSRAGAYTGTLAIDGATYPLAGTAFNPSLPAPALGFDSKTPQSGQQVTLSLTLPSPSPIAASGYAAMAFQPDPTVAGAHADGGIEFTGTSAATEGFTIQQGSTQAVFESAHPGVFQTGTTAGTITFTVTLTSGAQFSGAAPTASLSLAPLPMYLDPGAASAIAVAGALRISLNGFDNTYSAGPMSFTFRDNLGNAIGSGPVSADFTSNFHSYFFTQSADGGMFAMLLTFPVTGNAGEVGSVDIQLTNSAGTTTVARLPFINDTGSCVLAGNALSCPGSATQ